jgi:uncharacterized protein
MSDSIKIWPDDAVADRLDNKVWLRSLKQVNHVEVYVSLQQLHTEVFAKTDCLACANCCKTTPAIVTNADKSRIAKHLGMSPKAFAKSYLMEDINGDYMYKQVPCVFLQSDNVCSIYDVRPEACRRYPHTDEQAYAQRPDLNVANTIVCPAAYQIMMRLKETLALSQ